ncbi:MAG: PhzF family phenazine biosynthesis protein [Prochlorothrix sp.]
MWDGQRTGARAYRFYTLDVFCDRPFGGNPLAIVPEATGLTTEEMQRITREFNLSETVFVLPPETAEGTCRVRIFTPGQEIPFAGHPTVGTAFLLAALGQGRTAPIAGGQGTIAGSTPAAIASPTGPIAEDPTANEITLVLEEGIGPVPVVVQRLGDRPVSSQLVVTQQPDRWTVDLTAAELAQILGLEPQDIGWTGAAPAESPDPDLTHPNTPHPESLGLKSPKSPDPKSPDPKSPKSPDPKSPNPKSPPWEPEAFSCGLPYCFVPVATRSALGRIQLQIDRWQTLLAPTPYPHLYCFCPEPEHPAAQFRARMFAPALGIGEDAATGSAVTAFAGYLSARSPVHNAETGAAEVTEAKATEAEVTEAKATETLRWGIEQGVEMGRPSFLSLEIDRVAGSIVAIRVGGRSVPISEGTIYL